MKTPKKTGDANLDAAMQDSLRDLPRFVSCGRIDVLTANEAFAVPHTLGDVPEFFHYVPWAEGALFAPESVQSQWTEDTVVLVASVAGTFTLYVGRT